MPSITIDIRATGGEQLHRDIQQASNALGRALPGAAASADRSINALTKSFEAQSAVMARVRSQAIGLFAGAIGVSAIAGLTRTVVDNTNALIGWRNAFSAVTPDAKAASASMAFVRSEAERLGLSLESSATQFTKLSAATRGTALEGEQTRKIFSAVSEASRVLNLSVDSTEGAFRALEQMVSKGKVQAEELRGQLGERLPGAFRLSAEALGVTTAQLNKMLELGEVTAENLLPKLADRLQDVYSVAAMNAANSPAAEFNRLRNAIFDLNVAIGESGVVDALADGARGLSSAISSLVESGGIEKIASGLVLMGEAAAVAFGGRALGALNDYRKNLIEATDQTIKSAQAAKMAAQASVVQAEQSVVAAAMKAREAQAQRDFYVSTEKANAAQVRLKAAQDALKLSTMQLIAAKEGIVVASNQAAIAQDRLGVATARMATIAKSGFALIGGWPTVILAAVYASYKLWDSFESGGAKMADALDDADNIINNNERSIRRLEASMRGIDDATVDTIIAFENLGIASAEAEQKLATLTTASTGFFDTLSGKALAGGNAIAAFSAYVYELGQAENAIENAKEKQLEFIESSLRLAIVQAQAAADSGKNSDAVERLVSALQRSGAEQSVVEEAMRKVAQASAENALSIDDLALVYRKLGGDAGIVFADLIDGALRASDAVRNLFTSAKTAATEGVSELSKETQKLIDGWTSEAEQIGKTKQQLIELSATRRKAAIDADDSIKDKQREKDAIDESASALIRAIDAEQKKKVSRTGLSSVEKEATQIARSLANAYDEMAAAYRKSEAAISPLHAIMVEYEQAVDDAAKKAEEWERALVAGGVDATTAAIEATKLYVAEKNRLTVARDKDIQSAKEELASANEYVDVIGIMREELEQELRLLGLSGDARRVEEMYIRMVNDAKRSWIGLSAEEVEARKEEIRLAAESAVAQLSIAEAAAQAAEDSARAWEDFAYGLADAVVEGGGSVKKYFKRLLDDLKKQIIASGLMNLFKGIFNVGGGSGGAFTSMLGAIFGGAGIAVTGSPSGGASAGNVVQGSSIWGQVASAALGGGGSGGGLNIFNPSSWVSAGKQLWNGFTGMFGGGNAAAIAQQTGNFGAFGPGGAAWNPAFANQATGITSMWGTVGAGGTFAPSMLSYGAAGLGGLYAGYNRYQNSGGGLAGGLGAATYGLAAYGVGMGAASVAAGGTFAAGVGAAGGSLGMSAAAIPVVGWIVAIAAIVDMISGGKLFGTAFRPEQVTQSIGVGEEGAYAEAEMREVRNRSLFRGRQWRTTNLTPGEEALAAAEALYMSIEDVMVDSARRLRGTAPGMIDAAIRTVQDFDSKGRVKATKLFVDILGRSWEAADADEAAQRIAAEAMIATIDGILGYRVAAASVLPPGTTLPPVTGPGGGPGGASGVVPPWMEPPGDMAPKALATLAAVANAQEETQAMLGEASSIAERWRSDVELLTVGATFLLQVASDMRSGFALLGEGPGSLTAVTDLVEELAYGGESLVDTYGRIAASTAQLEQALGLMGLQLESDREAFVRFAVDIAEAAGGVERAGALWGDYFSRFFSAEERAAYALSQAESGAGREFGDIGLSLADYRDPQAGARFRELFEQLMPSLTADAIVQWLEAANALGIVIDAELALAQARGSAVDVITRNTEAIDDLLSTIGREDMLAGLTEYGRRMAEISLQFDDYREQLSALGATTEELAELEGYRTNALERARAEMQEQINEILVQNFVDSLSQSVSEYNDGAIEVIRRFDELRAQMVDLGASSAQLTALELQRANALARVAQQVEASSRALIEQLGYTALGMIERQIAELESSASAASDATAGVVGGLKEITSAAQAFRDSIMIDQNLSGLSIADQYTEALRQLRETGDTGTARRALELARSLNASGADYRGQRDLILSLVRDTQEAVGSAPTGGGGAVSPELAALYAERDRLLAMQEAAERLSDATTLLQNLSDLSRISGESVLDVAARLGLADMERFAQDLGLEGLSAIDEMAAAYLTFDPLTMISAGDQAIIDAILNPPDIATNPGFVVDPMNPDPGGKAAEEQETQDSIVELLARVADRLDELVPMAASTGDSTVGLLRRIADNATDPTLKPRVAVPNG